MKNIFYRALSVIMLLAFGFLTLFLLLGSGMTPLFMIMAIFAIVLGAALLALYWPRFSGEQTVATEQPQFMVSRGVYTAMMITLAVSFLYEGYTYFSDWSLQHTTWDSVLPIVFIGIIVVSFLLTFASKSIRGKYTFIELLTMKARDEREQHIINTVARSTYVFIRILVVIVALLFFGLQLSGVTLSAFSIGYILLSLAFVAHAYFMILLRKHVE